MRNGEAVCPVAAAAGPRRRDGGGSEPDARSDSAVVQLKEGVTAARSVRDGLVQVVHWLSDQPRLRGYLLLADPRLGRSLLQTEFLGLQAAMRPEVAERLYLVVARRGQLERGGPLGQAPIPDDDWALLTGCLAAAADPQTVLPNPRKREEILWVLIDRWVRRAGPVKVMRLENLVGCNYRTAAAVVEKIRPALVEHSDRQIELARFPEEAWRESLSLQGKARATMRFAFASGPPRSSEQWIDALKALGRSDIAVGGALGAQRHHPGLRCPTGARLDLCVHAPGRTVDLDFVARLAPALRRVDAPRGTAHVAVRFVRRRESPFSAGEDGLAWADPIECLLGLHDAHLNAEAAALEANLRGRGRASLPDWPFWGREPTTEQTL